jgi:O-antigen/teichoic acid export membrane protein
LGNVAPLAVSIIATPFTIRLLGPESYGVYVLIGLIPNYVAFADLGMSLASTKFAAEAYSVGDTAKEARIVRTAAVISSASWLPVVLGLFVFSWWIVGAFNVPEGYRSEASLALKAAAAAFGLNILSGIFNTPQLTRLRMDLNSVISTIPRILLLIATPLVVYFGFGIHGIYFAALAAAVMTLGSHLVVSGRLNPELFGTTLERGAVRPLLVFGGGAVMSAVAGILLVNLEKGVTAAMLSPTDLAHYSIAYSLSSMASLFSLSLLQSLIPAFSQLQHEGRREQLQMIFSRGIRFSILLAVPLLLGLSVVAEPFFYVWAGSDFARHSTVPFYLLIVGLALNLPAYLPVAALISAGRMATLGKMYFAELIFFGPLVVGLTYLYGINGAAAAWTIRVTIDAILLYYLAWCLCSLRFPTIGPGLIASAVFTVGLTLTVLVLLRDNLPVAIAAGSATAAIGLAFFFHYGKKIIQPDEIQWVKNIIRARLLGLA